MFLESQNDCTSIEKALSLCVHVEIAPTILPFKIQNDRLLENLEHAKACPLNSTVNCQRNVFLSALQAVNYSAYVDSFK